MPPKAKYTREEIVQVALDLVAEKGMEALNARSLAAELGTSTRPLFTAFKNMGELNHEVQIAVMKRFEDYARRLDSDMPAFKSVGMQMILFAAEQPKLFRLLFMREETDEPGGFDSLFRRLGSTSDRCIDFIRKDYGLDEDKARMLFRTVWVFTYGICSLISKGVCSYNEDEVSEMITAEFSAVMGLVRSDKS